jgi:nucleotide-binding universal stress UspA family protein
MPEALPTPPTTILVGLDGSSMSHRAVAHAAMLASAFDAEVVAVHAVGLLTVLDGEAVPSDSSRDRIEAAVDAWAAPLREAGVRHRTVLEDGPPGLVLLRLIDRTSAGLVVLGTRGIGSADGVVLGSTSYHLVQHSPVPVLVTH